MPVSDVIPGNAYGSGTHALVTEDPLGTSASVGGREEDGGQADVAAVSHRTRHVMPVVVRVMFSWPCMMALGNFLPVVVSMVTAVPFRKPLSGAITVSLQMVFPVFFLKLFAHFLRGRTLKVKVITMSCYGGSRWLVPEHLVQGVHSGDDVTATVAGVSTTVDGLQDSLSDAVAQVAVGVRDVHGPLSTPVIDNEIIFISRKDVPKHDVLFGVLQDWDAGCRLLQVGNPFSRDSLPAIDNDHGDVCESLTGKSVLQCFQS